MLIVCLVLTGAAILAVPHLARLAITSPTQAPPTDQGLPNASDQVPRSRPPLCRPAQQNIPDDAAQVVRYVVTTQGAVQTAERQFACAAAEVLADPQGWAGVGVFFQEAGQDEPADFVLILAAPEELPSFSPDCTPEYSCRVGSSVVINELRWLEGTEASNQWGWDARTYQTMVINHEVGHFLGLDHSYCAGPGETAPLMMQQSKGLDGCTPNPYPLPEELAQVSY
ncbi:MAG: DUF3152 domain-containing protein [Bifidobacteriaceae bacterium]|nr:DUF3152 domain-containing protein [Bifidobacteriaceae bacterium]